ncbi:MAG TPA: alkaline phosphatase family protein, partial [Pilimelia sp.]|nr:alkaline phosphatase family protein [Pilimelia sp.]
WHTGVPATTPAVQAGLLHGDASAVPAFRWFEKETRRLVVTSRPRDAAAVERRVSDGAGLLSGGGASIGNVFTGDASINLLTVSNAALPGRSARGYAAFMTSPSGFARAVVLGAAEMIKEWHQARLQRRRDVQPRVRRAGAYLILRPISNVLLRDLNVSLIAEQMARGTPVIFCTFVDYDEVAHYAGPARPEALHSLEGLDRVAGILARLAEEGARDYRLVVLSDHGQSQGATFRQRFGETLEHVVRRLLSNGGAPAAGVATAHAEQWGPVNALLTGVAGRSGPAGSATRAAIRSYAVTGEVALGPAEEEQRAIERSDPDLVVVASGNLAMVYFAHHPGKLTREQLDALHPDLVAGLAAHPGIGAVIVGTAADGPVAVGAEGTHRLRDGRVTGRDPLAPYGPHARADLLRHQAAAHVGDIVVISLVEPGTDEVAAFEELVGCHGGLGGWQTEAVLVYPAGLTLDTDDLTGPEAVHRQLVRWRDELNPPAAPVVAAIDGRSVTTGEAPAMGAAPPVRLPVGGSPPRSPG